MLDDALMSAAAAVTLTPGPARKLPPDLPEGIDDDVAVGAFVSLTGAGLTVAGFPLRAGRVALPSPEKAPSAALTVTAPSEVWLLAGRLHCLVFGEDGEEVETVWKLAGREWVGSRKQAGRPVLAAAGVRVWVGAR